MCDSWCQPLALFQLGDHHLLGVGVRALPCLETTISPEYFPDWCLFPPCSSQCFHSLTSLTPSILVCSSDESLQSEIGFIWDMYLSSIHSSLSWQLHYRFVIVYFTYFRDGEFEKDQQWSGFWKQILFHLSLLLFKGSHFSHVSAIKYSYQIFSRFRNLRAHLFWTIYKVVYR